MCPRHDNTSHWPTKAIKPRPLPELLLRYQWGFRYLSLFFFIIKLNNIFLLLQILLQDKYNISVLTVNIEFMWLGKKRVERLDKSRPSPVSKPRHIHSVFIVNTPILYMYYVYAKP
jgi:hypothetical protein